MKINVSLTDLNLDAQQNVKQGLTISIAIFLFIRVPYQANMFFAIWMPTENVQILFLQKIDYAKYYSRHHRYESMQLFLSTTQ